MKWRIIAAGKPALKYARDGIAEYEKRLQRYVGCEIVYVRPGNTQEETESRFEKAAEGSLRVILDERGALLTTEAFKQKVDAWELEGTVKAVSLIIGAADGHSDEFRKSADLLLGLSGFTLQHELALVVLLEQIYRVYTMKKGETYHR
jgi:23S rRNA (pseudouridine1915-N3)-methyltransferase